MNDDDQAGDDHGHRPKEGVEESGGGNALRAGEKAAVRKMRAYEEPTNAGIPTVGVTLEIAIPTTGILLKFKGSTPLGTSAGTGEAIHLVDNVVEQAEQFGATAGVDGVVLTKLDGTAKGGVVMAIADRLKLPVRWIGVGEGVDDLLPFDVEEFVDSLLDIES